jgi:hypothetical protein
MKTKDVRVNKQYLFRGQLVIVIKRIIGQETNKPNMQSKELFIGYKRKRKRFLLNNGMIIFSNELTINSQ